MRDFDYYRTLSVARPDTSLAAEHRFLKGVVERLEKQPLTGAERNRLIKQAIDDYKKEVQEKLVAYRKEQEAKVEEFWRDCREDLGYTSFLNAKGVKMLEDKAYEDGHSYGYCSIYDHLSDLVDFVSMLRENMLTNTNNR